MKKLVIIGGGFAGTTIARKLENKFDTTLIDTKDYFEFTPGILRTIVEINHINKIQIKHLSYLKKTNLIIGEVSQISKNKVKVSGKSIDFDYLCICSGSKYNSPIKEQNVVLATRAEHLKDNHSKLKESKKVLIIGGGLAGVELAAEICTHYKDKEITIINSSSSILSRNKDKSISYAEKFLNKHNVKVINNEKIMPDKNKKTFHTDKGRSLEADITFLCTGISPNFSFMEKNFSSKLNDKNFIIVEPTLNLKNETNIFVAGDINDMKVEKTAQNAEKQALLVIRNILNTEHNRPLESYHSKQTPIVISLGKHSGILEYRNTIITGFIPAIIKKVIEKKEMIKLKYL